MLITGATAALLVAACGGSGASGIFSSPSGGSAATSGTHQFVGTLSGSNALIAIETSAGGVGVYVCDGENGKVRLARLLTGSVAGGGIDLTDADEDHLTAHVGANDITGSFTPAGGSALSFDAALASDPVFYEATQTSGGTTTTARWIATRDDQRGAVHKGKSLRAAPRLNVSSLSATIGGSTVRATKTSLLKSASSSEQSFSFTLVRSAGVAGCLSHATASVTIRRGSHNDLMKVTVEGFPKNIDLTLFVIELPNKPFGLSWYQSDVKTGDNGKGTASVRGIFNIETFTVSPGGTVAVPPTHQYHLGMWFDDPAVPFHLGCETGKTAPVVTPFNGSQNAGIQALNSSNFPDGAGPLSHVKA